MRRSASIVLRRRRSVSWARQSEEPAVRAAWTLPPILVRNPRSKPILSPLPCSPYSTRAAAHTGRKRPEFAGFRACLLVRPSLSGIRAPSRFSAPSPAALILRGLWRMPAGNALNSRASGHAFWFGHPYLESTPHADSQPLPQPLFHAGCGACRPETP